MKEALRRSPTSATDAGYHLYVAGDNCKTSALDPLLDDLSKKAMEENCAWYIDWRDSLSPEDAADWQLINDKVNLELLELVEITIRQWWLVDSLSALALGACTIVIP